MLEDIVYTSVAREMAEELLNFHFPSDACPSRAWDFTPLSGSQAMLLEKAITEEKIKWAVLSFSPSKSPGLNGIHSFTLQKVVEVCPDVHLPAFYAVSSHWLCSYQMETCQSCLSC